MSKKSSHTRKWKLMITRNMKSYWTSFVLIMSARLLHHQWNHFTPQERMGKFRVSTNCVICLIEKHTHGLFAQTISLFVCSETPAEVFAALKDLGYSSFRAGQEEAIMRILSGTFIMQIKNMHAHTLVLVKPLFLPL